LILNFGWAAIFQFIIALDAATGKNGLAKGTVH